MIYRPSAPLVLIALVMGIASCNGSIGDPEGTVDPSKTAAGQDPGRVTIHRLNRAEYNNTVRDLLGTALRPADDFPTDDHSFGFDNIADTLTISPTQLELYARAAETLAHEAIELPSTAETHFFEAEDLMGTVGAVSGQAWLLWSNGQVPVQLDAPADGTYAISTLVWGDQAGPDPAQMSITVDGLSVGQWDVPEISSAPKSVEIQVALKKGPRIIAVEFLNDYYDQVAGEDRNLYVDWLRIEGPLDAPADNPIRDRLLICDPAAEGEACVRDILGKFASRAWRRPLTDTEVDALMGLYDLAIGQGDTSDAGLEVALTAILLSPHFIFRVELDADPAGAESHPLTGYELASRLSYFLWSSMPDDELTARAADGTLDSEEGLKTQVTRMLADPKSDALIDNFAGQWLYTRALADHTPDYMAFPTWDADLGDAMSQETRRLFADLLRGEKPIQTLLTADFTYLNDRLASHYGLPLPGSVEPVLVNLPQDSLRGGILTQGSLLTVTSYPRRTSPVKRGKWVLSQLLCSEPPPPPPGVEGLEEEEVATGSIRERLEAHRADPVCASCHVAMDGIGFALENFDGIGAFRSDDNGYAIDATGTFPTGESFDGARELSTVVASDPRLLPCVADKLMTYALGRSPGPSDAPYLSAISQDTEAAGSKMRDLVLSIVLSDPFRTRRGEPVSEGGAP